MIVYRLFLPAHYCYYSGLTVLNKDFIHSAHNVSPQRRQLKLVSYNMHGFNQGCPTINELINTVDPDIILCQEHWLTPANLDKFDNHYPN